MTLVKWFLPVVLVLICTGSWSNDFSQVQNDYQSLAKVVKKKFPDSQTTSGADLSEQLEILASKAAATEGTVADAYRLARLKLAMAFRSQQGFPVLAEVVDQIPATNPAWEPFPDLVQTLVMTLSLYLPQQADAYCSGFLDNPSRTVVATAEIAMLINTISGTPMEDVEAKYARYVREYPQLPILADLSERIRQEKNRPRVGKLAPDFEVPDFLNPANNYQLASFAGKYLLVDFWATWCPPCVAEIPHVTKAYEAFNGKGFEVLSVSTDESIGDLSAFLEDAGDSMPWKHACVGDENAILMNYNIEYLPSLFLIDPDGKVVAMGDSLRNGGLEEHLGKLFRQ